MYTSMGGQTALYHSLTHSLSLVLSPHHQGVREERSFSDWKMTLCKSETAAREQLKRSGAEHYWDMALSESIVEQEHD